MSKKISLFFGAGAECSYGLPSGGKFAVEIFRQDITQDKELFRNKRSEVNSRSSYAKFWLPDNYKTKNITSFGRSQYESLVKGSLANNKKKILDYLNKFDENINHIIDNLASNDVDINAKLENTIGMPIGKETFSHDIKLSRLLGENNGLFSSNYFSAMLKILEIEELDREFKKKIGKISKSILELLIGACGESLIQKLNDNVFEITQDSIGIFDDLGGIFSLDYKRTGMTGLEYIMEEEKAQINDESSPEEIILEFGRRILEDIYSQILDYQTLIDSNWRFVYSPKTDWGKFTKIVIFLYSVSRYIQAITEKNNKRCFSGPGYYHDIENLVDSFEITSIGTTNYNTFIREITNCEVFFLNGSVEDMYDPYLNNIISEDENNGHITVPFLFTQSGIKPLTSVKISRRYVNMFDKFKDSDVICVIGYGFNSDDGHINGLFRSLIEDEDKKLVIFHHVKNSEFNLEGLKNKYQRDLRLENISGIDIIPIKSDRTVYGTDSYWYEEIKSRYGDKYKE